MKNSHKALAIATVGVTGFFFSVKQVKDHKKSQSLALGVAEALGMEAGTDSCFTTFQSVLSNAPKKDTYADAVLDHLHDEVYRFNNIATADIELIFCRLATIMEVAPDLNALPQTVTKTDPMGSTITVTVSAPTEAFALTAGYSAKAEIKNDDTTFMTLWWDGSGTTSKGYLIQGANPMQKDGNKRLRYAQWDRTSSAQTIKLMATQFATSFLNSAASSGTSKTGGDNAVFGRMSYNSDDKVVTSQQIEIRAGNSEETASTFKCVRTRFTGTIGGTVTGFRPAKGTPESVNETTTGGTSEIGELGLDGEKDIVDSTTTADHSGTPVEGTELATGTFDYSCKDINEANATGKFFANDTVDFTMSPSVVFPK